MLESKSISKKVVYASLLGFIGTSLMVISQTYSSMIFITNYPSDQIPYLYIASGLIAAILMQLLSRFMNRSLNLYAMTTHLAFILLYIAFIALLEIKNTWIPFIFSTSLLITVAFTSTTYILVQMRPFTLREFKSIGKWMSASSTFGAVIWGALIPLLLKIGTSEILLFAVILLLIAAVFVIQLSSTEPAIKPLTHQTKIKTISLFKNPLFLYLFIVGILAQIIQISGDFAPKSLLSSYSKQEIGNILGPFYSLVNIIAIISQFLFAGKIINRFGIFGILLILPITVIPVAVMLYFIPHLWVALLFFGVALSSRFGFFASGQQMVMNVLPDSVIENARYQMGSLGRNLGIGVAGLVLLILNNLGGLKLAAIGAIVASTLLIYYFLNSKQRYKQILVDSINLHRFNLDYVNNIETDRLVISSNAEAALKSDQVDIQLFGLELLSHIHYQTVPKAMYAMLESDSATVRISALRLIETINDPGSWRFLRDHLDKETDPETIYQLVRTILKHNVSTLLPFAFENINSTIAPIQCSVIIIFLKGGSVDEVISSLKQLKKLSKDPKPENRMVACDILRNTEVGDFSTTLLALLKDENIGVVSKAIKAAKKHHSDEVINAILDNLRFKNLYNTISKTLLYYGPEVLNMLTEKIKDEKHAHLIVTMINILSLMPQESAEDELINLLSYPQTKIQNPVVRGIAYRSLNYSFKKSHKAIIKSKISETISLIQTLMVFSNSEADYHIRNEINSRIMMARRRYLHLIVALFENKVILQLIPSLMYSDPKSSLYSKALELLDVNIPDRSLVSTIGYALENKKQPGVSAQPDISSLSDAWLNELIDFRNGKIGGEKMDIISKILVLREVALFNNLSAEALESIAEAITVIDIPKNQIIFNQGDLPDGLYIIAKGQVVVKRDSAVLKEYHENEFFGELALLDNEPRTGTATSTTDCVLYLVEKSDFNRLTDDIPEILKIIIQTIMTYLRPYLSHA